MTRIAEMKLDTPFEGNYLIKSAEVRKTRAGKDYLSLTFQDKTGTISGNLWDASTEQIEVLVSGEIVHVSGQRELYNDRPQVGKLQVQLIEDGAAGKVKDYREQAPVDTDELRDYVQNMVFQIENGTWQRIVRQLLKKFDQPFFEFPAAKSNHHAFEGGLAYHEATMLQLAEKIADVYPALNRSLLYAGIILHDMAKVLEFTGFENTDYTLKGNLIGHIVLIDGEIVKAAQELELSEDNEDLLLLRHVVLSHHGLLEYGSPVRPQIMEAEIIHQIDMMDASVMMMSTALRNVESGHRSAKVWPMENRYFYKPHATEGGSGDAKKA